MCFMKYLMDNKDAIILHITSLNPKSTQFDMREIATGVLSGTLLSVANSDPWSQSTQRRIKVVYVNDSCRSKGSNCFQKYLQNT